MPRLNEAIPKYRKHRASGQAVVTLSGRDFYLGPHNSQVSKDQYDRLISEWLLAGRTSSFGAPASEMTVAELLLQFLDYASKYYGDSSPTEYAHYVRVARPANAIYGNTLAACFGPLELKVVRQRLIDDGCSRSHTNALVRRLCRVFRWGSAEGLVPVAVPQSLSMVEGLKKGRTEAKETPPVLPVEDATVEATLEHLSQVVGDMVRLQRLTAARPAEICIVRPCDIDRQGDIWQYSPSRHKTQYRGRERTIPIGPRGQSILLRYLARDPETYCFRPADSESKRLAELHAERITPLSCGNRPGSRAAKRGKKKRRKQPGDIYTTDSYRRAIHYACDKAFPHPTLGAIPRTKLSAEQLAELKDWQSRHRWSPNQLRHAAATEIRREFGLEAAQISLGHSTAEVTQVYAERDMSKGIEIAMRIG